MQTNSKMDESTLTFIIKFTSWCAAVGAAVKIIPKTVKAVISTFKKASRVLGWIEKTYEDTQRNGGATSRDALFRIEKTVNEVRTDQLQNKAFLRAVVMDDGKMIFQSDKNGACVWVNRTYLRRTGLGIADCLGFGWINAICNGDRKRVQEDWHDAVMQKREFVMEYCMHDILGVEMIVRCNAFPQLDSDGNLVGFTGLCTVIKENHHHEK